MRNIYRAIGTTHDDKFLLTWELVNRVDDYGGRFLEMGVDEQWYEMNDKDTRKKASHGKHFGHVVNDILLTKSR